MRYGMPEAADETRRRLWERVRSGSRSAFDALASALEASLRGFIRRLIGQSDAEEDIVRESLLALYQNRSRIAEYDGVRPFLYRVARNLSYGELRWRSRWRTVPLGNESDGVAAPANYLMDLSPTPDGELERLLLWAEVSRGIDRLPEPQRQAMILYVEEDMAYAEIAQVMNTDLGTVKSRLFHARTNLIRTLTPEVREALGVLKKEK